MLRPEQKIAAAISRNLKPGNWISRTSPQLGPRETFSHGKLAFKVSFLYLDLKILVYLGGEDRGNQIDQAFKTAWLGSTS